MLRLYARNVRFQNLSAPERREALETATSLGGRPAHLLEKDIWVVQTLSVLFETPFGRDLVFKGGTSLAKAYRAIRRFSEDVDTIMGSSFRKCLSSSARGRRASLDRSGGSNATRPDSCPTFASLRRNPP